MDRNAYQSELDQVQFTEAGRSALTDALMAEQAGPPVQHRSLWMKRGMAAVLAAVLAAGSAVIFAATPFDKELFMAMLLMYALPAPFIIPLFADTGEDGAYISTTLSVGTLMTVVFFIGIAAYSAA